MVKNYPNYRYDPLIGELYLNKISCELTTRKFHNDLRREFEAILGAVAKSMFYTVGKVTGMIVAKYFDDIDVLSWMGWGVPLVKKDGSVEVKNSYMTMYRSEISKKSCDIVAGFLAGWFSRKEKDNVDFIESRCASTTKSKTCRFERVEKNVAVEVPKIRMKKPREHLKNVNINLKPSSGEIIYRGDSSLIIPRGFTAIFQREFERVIGAVASRKMYEVVKKISYEAVVKEQGFRFIGLAILPKFIRAKLLLHEELVQLPERGFGNVRVLRLDLKEGILLEIDNSYNAFTYGKVGKPVCHTLAGVLAGGAKAVIGGDWECVENKCVAAGDGVCEFELKPA